jgi:hypothetical protein
VFLFGVSSERIVNSLPAGLARLRICCIAAGDPTFRDIHMLAADAAQGGYSVEPCAPNTRFGIVVLLAPASEAEIAALVDRMSPEGVILDCLGQAAGHGELLRRHGDRVREISLGRALSGEILNLLASGTGRLHATSPSTVPEESRRMEHGPELRAA